MTLARARIYRFGTSRLTVRFGDIVAADAQVLVSSDDCYITMGGGVSAAILRAGGEAIPRDAAKKVPAALGDVVVTTAGALHAQYVFHAITIGPNPENLSAEAIVERTTRRCMRLLDSLELTAIAFPAIGAGVARFSYDDVAARMAEVIADELSRRSSPADVSIFLFDRSGRMDDMDFIRFFEEFSARAPRVASKAAADFVPALAPRESATLAAETQEEYKRRRIHNLRRLLADLEEQRAKLEQHLIALIGTDEESEEQHVRDALAGNQEFRLKCLNELQSYLAQTLDGAAPVRAVGALTVFVSSTWLDLIEYRATVKDAIARCDLFFRGMEYFGADPDRLPPAKVIVDEVRKADAYLGIFGVRYGSLDPATGLSMTELEFREAEIGKKPMLLYVMHQDASVPVSHIETDSERVKKLSALKEHILEQYVVYQFRSADDLGRQAREDLAKLKLSAGTGRP